MVVDFRQNGKVVGKGEDAGGLRLRTRGQERQEAKTGIVGMTNVWRRFKRERDRNKDRWKLRERQGKSIADMESGNPLRVVSAEKGDRVICRLFSLLAFC